MQSVGPQLSTSDDSRIGLGKLTNRGAQLAAVSLLALSALACGGGAQEPEVLPSQTVTRVTPQLEPPPTGPAMPPITEVPPTESSALKVIDPGGNSENPLTLGEASRLAKEVKASSAPAVVTITDENLAEYASGGDVTIMESEPAAPALAEQVATSVSSGSEPLPADSVSDRQPPDRAASFPAPRANRGEAPRGDDEGYWRSRALDLRRGWRGTVDEINELELQSAALRQQFYAEDDPYLRDSQIKPAWDRALDRLDALRREASVYEAELEAFVDDGRRAGAEQGWLNEGWELEPDRDEQQRANRIGIGASKEPEDTLEAQDLTTLEREN